MACAHRSLRCARQDEEPVCATRVALPRDAAVRFQIVIGEITESDRQNSRQETTHNSVNSGSCESRNRAIVGRVRCQRTSASSPSAAGAYEPNFPRFRQ